MLNFAFLMFRKFAVKVSRATQKRKFEHFATKKIVNDTLSNNIIKKIKELKHTFKPLHAISHYCFEILFREHGYL
jgi:hypothetical protein